MHDRTSVRRKLVLAAAALGIAGTLGVAGVAHASTAAHAKSGHLKKTIVRDGYRCTKIAKGRGTTTGVAGQVVCALGGRHTLVAQGAGHVVLIAAGGNDRLVGSSAPGAHDTLIGGKGHDVLVAGASGNDVIETGSGSDSIDCGTGGQVTVVGDDSGDQESSDCQDNGDVNVSQWWHGTVAAVATDNSTVTVSVSESSDGAQSWLQSQSPACDLASLVFDLTTTPANVQVDGGGALVAGDDVEIESEAGTVNCEPVAVNVEAQPSDNANEDGDASQHWAGTVSALASNGSTMTVAVSDSSDGAQAWLAAQNPACDPFNLVFDLKSAPAAIQVDGGGPLAVGDDVEVESTSGTTNCVPVATMVNSDGASSSGEGDQGGLGGDGGVFGLVSSVGGSSAAGTCGTAGSAGSFVVTSPDTTTTTVNVDTTTNFVDPALSPAPSATFASVCVGDIAGAVGTVSSGGVAASWVVTAPLSFVSTGGDWNGTNE